MDNDKDLQLEIVVETPKKKTVFELYKEIQLKLDIIDNILEHKNSIKKAI